jgi:hypothetical protein
MTSALGRHLHEHRGHGHGHGHAEADDAATSGLLEGLVDASRAGQDTAWAIQVPMCQLPH